MTVDRGPEAERRDLICPSCNAVYFEIEPSRAQKLHNVNEACKGKLRELTNHD